MNGADGDPIDQQVSYDRDGLVPCVVQDWSSGEVLTLAYMNEQALARTLDSGELHLWSRSRDEQWHKGATSGNVQRVRALRLDCDGDTAARARRARRPRLPHGRAHLLSPRPAAARWRPTRRCPALERTLAERARERPPGLLHRASCSTTPHASARR